MKPKPLRFSDPAGSDRATSDPRSPGLDAPAGPVIRMLHRHPEPGRGHSVGQCHPATTGALTDSRWGAACLRSSPHVSRCFVLNRKMRRTSESTSGLNRAPTSLHAHADGGPTKKTKKTRGSHGAWRLQTPRTRHLRPAAKTQVALSEVHHGLGQAQPRGPRSRERCSARELRQLDFLASRWKPFWAGEGEGLVDFLEEFQVVSWNSKGISVMVMSILPVGSHLTGN